MNLDNLRDKIALIDEKIMALVSERLGVASEIGRLKKESNLPVLNQDVEDVVIDRYRNFALDEGIDPGSAENLADLLMSWSKETQK